MEQNSTFYMQLLQQRQSKKLSYTADEVDELLGKINNGKVLSSEEKEKLDALIQAYENGEISGGGGGGEGDVQPFTDDDIDDIWDSVINGHDDEQN